MRTVPAGEVEEAIRAGHFAKKQIFCPDRLISWSHSSRMEVGLEVARSLRPRRILDHGCGDGTFLALLMSVASPPEEAVGTEVSDDLVTDCRQRFRSVAGLEFARSEALDGPEHAGRYDVVVCMEVLEHVIDLPLELDRLERSLAPGGRLVVSVPVEVGLPLLVKLAYRTVAGWRGIGDYPGDAPYTFGEMARSIAPGERQHIPRVVYNLGDFRYHSHKGFNYRRLRSALEERFTIEREFGSPIAALPAALNSQAWFVARKP